MLSGANRTDMKKLADLLDARLLEAPEEFEAHLCLDRGYDYDQVRELAVAQRLQPHIRTRGEEIADKVRDPSWRPRRWVVEAAHSWLNRNRAILIRWSKKDENHLALLQLASGLIAFKKAHAATAALALPG